MGYDVYITRARHHLQGSQTPIPQGDWRVVIEDDPELCTPNPAAPDYARWAGPSSLDEPWIDWANGNLFSTDPDHSVIRKLVEITGLLGGRVQGEEGELYSVNRGQVVRENPAASRAPARVDPNASFSPPPDEALERGQAVRSSGVEVPVVVGQRVQTRWGRPATIVSIDPEADGGMGHIELKYEDGRAATTSCVAHGLGPI